MNDKLKVDNIRFSDDMSNFADMLVQYIKENGRERADALMKKSMKEIIEEFKRTCPEYFI